MERFIKKFKNISIADIATVGGKNASLGELFTQLSSHGICTPDGFAVTVSAFRHFLDYNNLQRHLQQLMLDLDKQNFSNLRDTGLKARQLILKATFPANIEMEIISAYKELCGASYYEVAVRSSATAEDLPNASFAVQHESYLNIKGEDALFKAVI